MIHLLEIPDDEADLSQWLENHLVGPNWSELVGEVLAIHGERERRSIEECLDGDLARVLEQGLSILGRDAIQKLFRSPNALIELQDHVFLEGGLYWERRIDAALASHAGPGPTEAPGETSVAPIVEQHRSEVASRRQWATLVLAASALLAVGSWLYWPKAVEPIASSWGFDDPNAFDQSMSEEEYLSAIASSAEKWKGKRPDTRTDIEKRLLEFVHGCDTLLETEHTALSESHRLWLLAACRKWRKSMIGHVHRLRSGDDPLEVRGAADETVSKAAKAIRAQLSF
jgi:hypothetical protein